MNIKAFNEYANNVPFDVTKIREDLDKIRAVIDDNGLSSVNYGALSVVAAIIASQAITTAKLADGSVTAAKLAPGAVTSTKIAAGAVTNTKLPAGGISGDRLETASIELGSGVDLSKAGPIKGIYLTINFADPADTAVEKTHDLNTTNISEFIVVGLTYDVNVVSAVFYALTVVDANKISLKCSLLTSTNTLTVKILLLYR